jgi:hypothetical protein
VQSSGTWIRPDGFGTRELRLRLVADHRGADELWSRCGGLTGFVDSKAASHSQSGAMGRLQLRAPPGFGGHGNSTDQRVNPHYFQTLKLKLVSGRFLENVSTPIAI